MARKRLTPNQVEYQKNIRRIQNFIRQKEKQGFSFPSINLQMPSRVTKKRLETIKAVRPDVLYALGTYHGEASYGEVIPANEARKLLRKRSKTRKAETQTATVQTPASTEPSRYVPSAGDIIISLFYMGLAEFREGRAAEMLKGWIDSLISVRGKEDVAQMLSAAGDAGYRLTWEVAYKEEMAMEFIMNVLDFLPDIGLNEKMAMMDALEEMGDWGRY